MAQPKIVERLRHGWKPPQQRPWNATDEGSRNGKPGKKTLGQTQLIAKREKLAKQFVELQWDLGGMAYEMASRDHFRLDVLNRQAAELQKVDAELGQIERVMKLDEAGAAGTCSNCGALQARGAVFCWQCGNEMTAPTGG